MGIPVLILGESGSGKSTSLRNFEPDEVGIFNVASKPLPFRKKLHKADHATYQMIIKNLGPDSKLPAYVIDDSQALMAFSLFSRAKEKGYDKFTDIAVDFYNLLRHITDKLPPDCIVYFLHHTDTLDSGKVKAKTVGKMLDNQLTLEGLFSIVLFCRTDGKEHWFETQSDGATTAKSPMGMLPEKMENDLKKVDTLIREYWELPARKPASDTAEQKPDADTPAANANPVEPKEMIDA